MVGSWKHPIPNKQLIGAWFHCIHMEVRCSEDSWDQESWKARAEALKRTLLARLALDVVDETIDSKASVTSFRGPEDGASMEQRCPICLEFVESGEQRYLFFANGDRVFPFHDHCLEDYMESQVTIHSGLSGK